MSLKRDPDTTMKTKTCEKHRMRKFSWSGKWINFRCVHCGLQTGRVPTKTEQKKMREDFKKDEQYNKKMHHVYHTFIKRFYDDGKNQWKLTGYAFMVAVEKWARRHPEVIVNRCDDRISAGSRLVLIPHKVNKRYWGTTVIFIPQCSGENPTEIFLYPSHKTDLIKSLHSLQKGCWVERPWK